MLDAKKVEKIRELHAAGKTSSEISRETGHSEVTVLRYIASQPSERRGDGREITIREEEGITIRPIGKVDELVAGIIGTQEGAGAAGQLTGVNLTQLARQAKRLQAGRGTPEEGKAFFVNLLGIAFGAVQGWRAYDEILPEEIEIAKSANMSTDEIVERVVGKQSETVAIAVKEAIKQLKEEGTI